MPFIDYFLLWAWPERLALRHLDACEFVTSTLSDHVHVCIGPDVVLSYALNAALNARPQSTVGRLHAEYLRRGALDLTPAASPRPVTYYGA